MLLIISILIVALLGSSWWDMFGKLTHALIERYVTCADNPSYPVKEIGEFMRTTVDGSNYSGMMSLLCLVSIIIAFRILFLIFVHSHAAHCQVMIPFMSLDWCKSSECMYEV